MNSWPGPSEYNSRLPAPTDGELWRCEASSKTQTRASFFWKSTFSLSKSSENHNGKYKRNSGPKTAWLPRRTELQLTTSRDDLKQIQRCQHARLFFFLRTTFSWSKSNENQNGNIKRNSGPKASVATVDCQLIVPMCDAKNIDRKLWDFSESK